jgi:hypothetical protein
MTTAQFSRNLGQVARAMAQVNSQHKPGLDVAGVIPCPKCGSGLKFTVLSNGLQRGQCAAAGCLRWSQ